MTDIDSAQKQRIITSLVDKGLELHHQNNLDGARINYEKALQLSPNNPNILRPLSVLRAQMGDFQEALNLGKIALQYAENKAEILNNQGLILEQLNRPNDAIESFNAAIEACDNFAHAYFNRGNALQQLNRFEEAIASYSAAIKANHQYFEAYFNRGNALQQLNRFEEAIASYDELIRLGIDDAETYNNRGVLQQRLMRTTEAITSYEHAIKIDPSFYVAYSNLGNALREQKKLENALIYYDLAINLNPGFLDAHFNRANTLLELSENEAAYRDYCSCLSINPKFSQARWALPFTKIPFIFEKIENLENIRSDFSNALNDLDKWLEDYQNEETFEAVGTNLPFLLAYQELNNKELLKQYGSIVSKVMSPWQEKNIQTRNIELESKINIGIFVSNQKNNYSVWNAITSGLVNHLNKNLFNITIFNLGDPNDIKIQESRAQLTAVIDNQFSLFDWTKHVLDKNIEVLIYPEIGMHPMTTQLAALRLAPIQMASWGHPETTGLQTIDYYLSAELFEPDGSENFYTEELIKLPNLGCAYKKLPISPTAIDLNMLGLEKNEKIFLCPGAYFKYAPQFDWVLAKIAKKMGRCKFVFFAQQKTWTDKLVQRLSNAFSDEGLSIKDFLIFAPWLNPDQFYGLMQKAHVFLDTIGFSGFNTAIQAIDCNLPIVTREGKFMRGRLASGILKRIGLQDLIANSEEGYIDLAVKLATNDQFRNNIQQKIRDNQKSLYDDLAPISYFEQFILKKCRPNSNQTI